MKEEMKEGVMDKSQRKGGRGREGEVRVETYPRVEGRE